MLKGFVEKNCQILFKYPLVYLISLILITCTAGYFYATLPIETSLESLLFEEDQDLLFYEDFKEEFGDNVSLVVGFSAPDVFTPEILRFIREQTEKLEKIQEVDEVISLSNIEYIDGSENDFLVQKLLEEIPTSTAEMEKLREHAVGSLLISGSVVNPDSQSTLFLILPTTDVNTPASDARLVAKVKEVFAAAKEQWPDIQLHFAGGIQTRLSLTEATNRDMLVFMPLTYLLLLLIVFFILRSPWLVLLTLLNISLCLIWTLAVLNLIGGAMGPMTSILPPLIMALAVSDSIHILTEFQRQPQPKSIQEKIHATLKTLATPCFLTSLTTAIGFMALSISDIPPIRHFGIAAAIGMMLEFFLSMTIIPLGIYLLRRKFSCQQAKQIKEPLLQKQLIMFAGAIPKYRNIILATGLLLIVGSAFATSLVQVETNLLEFFKKDSSTYQDALFVDQNLGGTETLEISLRTSQPGQLLAPETLKSIEKIEVFLQQQAIVSHVSSINDFFREMNQAFHNNNPQYLTLPTSRELAAQYLLLYDGNDMARILDPAQQWTHLSARLDVHSSKRIKALIDDLRNYIAEQVQVQEVDIRLTGQALIGNKLIDYIVKSQVQSLAMALMLIFLVMLTVFRSFKLGLVSIIPNVLPILFNFAIMGAVGIPLNSATAIIAAVAIGIAVDDTIHFLHAYQVQKKLGHSTQQSLQQTTVEKGMPLIFTSLILAGSFSILLLGSFIPTIQFGLLVALIMIFALVSDLLILPALLLITDK